MRLGSFIAALRRMFDSDSISVANQIIAVGKFRSEFDIPSWQAHMRLNSQLGSEFTVTKASFN